MLNNETIDSEELPHTVIVDLTHLIAASLAQEQKLDPASQTGDFVLPSGASFEPDEIGLNVGEVTDLTHEEVRVYHYDDGTETEVTKPVQLSIGPGGSHQITTFDRVGIVVPSGWFKCEVFPKFGEAAFAGHDPVHTIDTDE